MDLEKKYIASWFQNLSDKDKQKISYVSRLYSYHFDVYLNYIYRNKIFPRFQLLSHANDIISDSSTHDMWLKSMYSDSDLKNKFCIEQPLDKSPFKMFINNNKIKLSEYIDVLKKITLDMHNILTNYDLSYILQKDTIVYRSLRIKKNIDDDINIEKDINFELKGTTSTSTSLDSAQQFAFSPYGESKFYDERIFKSVIFEITLPKGTRVLPLNICTIQNENEILIISQGKLHQKNIEIDYCEWWNDYYNKYGKLVKAKQGRIPYLLIKANFEIDRKKSLKYKKNIKISEKIDNEFNNVVIDDISSSKQLLRKKTGKIISRKKNKKSPKKKKKSRSIKRNQNKKNKKSRSIKKNPK